MEVLNYGNGVNKKKAPFFRLIVLGVTDMNPMLLSENAIHCRRFKNILPDMEKIN